MAVVSKVTAKTYFDTGDVPTEAQFDDVIDSAAFLGEANEFSVKQKVTLAGTGIILGLGANDTDDVFTVSFNGANQVLMQASEFGAFIVKSGLYQKLILHGFGKDIECETSGEGGLVLPRLTTTERDAVGAWTNGTLIYNSTTNKAQIRAAGAWVDLH